MACYNLDFLLVSLFQLTIVLRMDDKMNRHLTSCISPGDNPKVLAQELVHYGFINEVSNIDKSSHDIMHLTYLHPKLYISRKMRSVFFFKKWIIHRFPLIYMI